MSAPDPTYASTNFDQALARLEEAIALPADDPTHRDSVILRFVLVYETAWTALRHCLAVEQIQRPATPRRPFARHFG